MAISRGRRKVAKEKPQERSGPVDREPEGPEDLFRVVFAASMSLDQKQYQHAKKTYQDFLLGLGVFEHLGVIREAQGLPSVWRAMGAGAALRKDRDLDNGEGFTLAIRAWPRDNSPLIARLGRVLRVDDPGPFGLLLKAAETRGELADVVASLRPSVRSKGLDEFLAKDRDNVCLLGVMVDHITMVPHTDGSGGGEIRHMVEVLAPPKLQRDGADRTLFTPEPWRQTMDSIRTGNSGDWQTASVLRTPEDLRSWALFIRKSVFSTAVIRVGEALPTVEAAEKWAEPLIERMAGATQFYIFADSIREDDFQAVVSQHRIPNFDPGTMSFLPGAMQRQMGMTEVIQFPVTTPDGEDASTLVLQEISETYQDLSDAFDGVQMVDDMGRERDLDQKGRKLLDREVAGRVQPHVAEAQKFKREARVALGQLKTLQGEVRRLGVAHAREKGTLQRRLVEVEARLVVVTQERDSLRTNLSGAAGQIKRLQRLVDGGSAEELERLMVAEDTLKQEVANLNHRLEVMEGDANLAETAQQDLRQRLHAAERRAESLGSIPAARIGIGNGVANGNGAERRARILAVLSGRPSLEQSLLFLQDHFGDRLTVLASALASARESDAADFAQREKAFGMLQGLVTTYWEALRTGRGDTIARDIFGKDGYASKESDTGDANERMRRERTFVYKGTPVYMGRHLKIGFRESLEETARIHFHWDAEDARIVIGHCGKHLYKLGF